MAGKQKFREMKVGSGDELLVHLVDSALFFGVVKHDQLAGLQGEYTPHAVMGEMELEPKCRADIVEACAKTDHETAEEFEPETAANNVVGALKRGRTTPKVFLEALTTWRLVLFMGATSIWRFFFVKMRWVDNSARKEHRALMAALLDKFIKLDLLHDNATNRNTCDAIVQAIGLKHFVSDKVPWEKREIVLELTYEHGKNAAKYILAELPPKDLVNWLKLEVLELALKVLAAKYGWAKEAKPASDDIVAAVPAAGSTRESDTLPIGDVMTVEAEPSTDNKPKRPETSGTLVVADDMVEEVSELDLEAEPPPPSSPGPHKWSPKSGDDFAGLGEDVTEAMDTVTGAPSPVRDTPRSFLAGRPSDHDTGPQKAQEDKPGGDKEKKERPLF